MRWSLSAGSAFGIPIRIHATLILVLVVLGVIFGMEGGDQDAWLEAMLFVLLLFGSVLVHELGHALVARRYDVQTREIILLPIGGIAVLASQPREAAHELWIALAGPATSLGLAAVASTLSLLVASSVLDFLVLLNVVLGCFNLLPAFPMDGGRVLRAGLSWRFGLLNGTRAAAIVGRVLALGLIAFALMTEHVALALIGAFVFFAAGSEERQVRLRMLVDSHCAGDVMEPIIRTFGAATHTEEILDFARTDLRSRAYPVSFGDSILGVIYREPLMQAVAQGYQPNILNNILDRNIITTRSDTPLRELLQDLGEAQCRTAVVKDEDDVRGIILADRLVAFLHAKQG